MIDIGKIGKNIASLRKARGFTGEQLAERLQVSSQAISKWENAKCLPDTAILPALAKALDCSIDSLLSPGEFFILEAIYTDGQTDIPVTQLLNALVRSNSLNICVNRKFVGAAIESDRLKLLTVKYRTPKGVYYTYALENECLVLDEDSQTHTGGGEFRIIGAWYGNQKSAASAMQRMEHYKYFKWDKIVVNHETFPSSPAGSDTEYLTVVYLNADGIHTISCPENNTLYYGKQHTQLLRKNESRAILPGIMRLGWGNGMECPWGGALHAALRYMGENYTYNQLMGMSGACYRTCFTEVWDYSCTDALVSFDFAAPLSAAIGRDLREVSRLEKQERPAERLAIMEDIRKGRPVLAINLRVAPEWGLITGYIDNGSRFLCRTYFDPEVFEKWEQEGELDREGRRETLEENGGYLVSELWPFLILHFGEKKPVPSRYDILRTSLSTLLKSFRAEACGGYYQGKEAYRAWITGLLREEDFNPEKDGQDMLRRLDVNDSMLVQLADSRSAAASWLQENASGNFPELSEAARTQLEKMAGNYRAVSDMVMKFRDKEKELLFCGQTDRLPAAFGASAGALRKEEAVLLEHALALDEENCGLAEQILKDVSQSMAETGR